jgi:hypothetical protein
MSNSEGFLRLGFSNLNYDEKITLAEQLFQQNGATTKAVATLVEWLVETLVKSMRNQSELSPRRNLRYWSLLRTLLSCEADLTGLLVQSSLVNVISATLGDRAACSDELLFQLVSVLATLQSRFAATFRPNLDNYGRTLQEAIELHRSSPSQSAAELIRLCARALAPLLMQTTARKAFTLMSGPLLLPLVLFVSSGESSLNDELLRLVSLGLLEQSSFDDFLADDTPQQSGKRQKTGAASSTRQRKETYHAQLWLQLSSMQQSHRAQLLKFLPSLWRLVLSSESERKRDAVPQLKRSEPEPSGPSHLVQLFNKLWAFIPLSEEGAPATLDAMRAQTAMLHATREFSETGVALGHEFEQMLTVYAVTLADSSAFGESKRDSAFMDEAYRAFSCVMHLNSTAIVSVLVRLLQKLWEKLEQLPRYAMAFVGDVFSVFAELRQLDRLLELLFGLFRFFFCDAFLSCAESLGLADTAALRSAQLVEIGRVFSGLVFAEVKELWSFFEARLLVALQSPGGARLSAGALLFSCFLESVTLSSTTSAQFLRMVESTHARVVEPVFARVFSGDDIPCEAACSMLALMRSLRSVFLSCGGSGIDYTLAAHSSRPRKIAKRLERALRGSRDSTLHVLGAMLDQLCAMSIMLADPEVRERDALHSNAVLLFSFYASKFPHSFELKCRCEATEQLPLLELDEHALQCAAWQQLCSCLALIADFMEEREKQVICTRLFSVCKCWNGSEARVEQAPFALRSVGSSSRSLLGQARFYEVQALRDASSAALRRGVESLALASVGEQRGKSLRKVARASRRSGALNVAVEQLALQFSLVEALPASFFREHDREALIRCAAVSVSMMERAEHIDGAAQALLRNNFALLIRFARHNTEQLCSVLEFPRVRLALPRAARQGELEALQRELNALCYAQLLCRGELGSTLDELGDVSTHDGVMVLCSFWRAVNTYLLGMEKQHASSGKQYALSAAISSKALECEKSIIDVHVDALKDGSVSGQVLALCAELVSFHANEMAPHCTSAHDRAVPLLGAGSVLMRAALNAIELRDAETRGGAVQFVRAFCSCVSYYRPVLNEAARLCLVAALAQAGCSAALTQSERGSLLNGLSELINASGAAQRAITQFTLRVMVDLYVPEKAVFVVEALLGALKGPRRAAALQGRVAVLVVRLCSVLQLEIAMSLRVRCLALLTELASDAAIELSSETVGVMLVAAGTVQQHSLDSFLVASRLLYHIMNRRAVQVSASAALFAAVIRALLRSIGASVPLLHVENFVRLFELIRQHKDVFKHYAVYVLLEFVELLPALPAAVWKALAGSFYVLLDCCTEVELRQLFQAQNTASKSIFKSLYESYKRDFKYAGKV